MATKNSATVDVDAMNTTERAEYYRQQAIKALAEVGKLETVQNYGPNAHIGRSGDYMFIVVNTTMNFGPSSSGKTEIISTTSGFTKFPDGVMVGLNVNRKA